jgi:uncharacterized protein (TIGR03083 family)
MRPTLAGSGTCVAESTTRCDERPHPVTVPLRPIEIVRSMTQSTPRTPVGTTLAELIDAWAGAIADLRGLADLLGDDGWLRPSVLPGWTVGDVIAHVGWIEHSMLGHADPPHQPDWSRLPHVDSPFGRITELPVDLRRGWPREAVLAEFAAAAASREATLRAGPQDPATPAVDPFGRRKTLDAVLRMRIFDTWVHGQDIRRAVGLAGGLETPGAVFTAQQIARALGFVWAKKVGAPLGSTLTVTVTPPGVALVESVTVTDDGRGRGIAHPDSATVAVTLSFDDFIQLGCGREWPDSSRADARGRVEIQGDPDLAALVLDNLNVAP